jgi:membrane protein YdbS with pleckstrin-like domain
MKFLAAIAVYVLIGVALGWGILLAVKGSLWFLAAGFVVYVLALAKLGCLPKAH